MQIQQVLRQILHFKTILGILAGEPLDQLRFSLSRCNTPQISVFASIGPVATHDRQSFLFGRGLMIRRFRLWLGDMLVYDEIN
jgi:hypothetical protein